LGTAPKVLFTTDYRVCGFYGFIDSSVRFSNFRQPQQRTIDDSKISLVSRDHNHMTIIFPQPINSQFYL